MEMKKTEFSRRLSCILSTIITLLILYQNIQIKTLPEKGKLKVHMMRKYNTCTGIYQYNIYHCFNCMQELQETRINPVVLFTHVV